MRVRFWGTRGSIPTPGAGTVRYGGNTSCVELRSDGGTLIVIDCGTGARPLGKALLAAEPRETGGSILISHTHWDHIQGLPFFEPLFQPGGRWDVYGPRGLGNSLAQTLAGQMQYQYFPVSLEQLGAGVTYHDLVEGTFEIGDLVVRTQYLNHPALTLGYRIEGDGAVVTYLADHEPHDPTLAGGGDLHASTEDSRHVAFLAGADVVIHDAQYVAAEYPTRIGWGHSTVEYAVDAAVAGGAHRLVLFHHDPTRDDDAVDALLARARERARAGGGTTTVDAAAEGLEIAVEPAARRRPTPGNREAAAASAVTRPALADLDACVVLAVEEPATVAVIVAAAAAEGLPVEVVGDSRGVADALARAPRPVVVVDVDHRADLIEDLRAASGGAELAVLGLSRRLPAVPPSAVTDWLVWPASETHVRTKLRAAVLRRACRWIVAPLAPDEERRLRSLRRLGVLDTAAEERFDRYTERARRLLGVPIALVSLVDADRQWFKSRRGIDVTETPRDVSVCAHAILGGDVLQVPDLLEDARFADSPAVAGEERARFYAGAPLTLADGSRVGTLCVVDHRPRLLAPAQLEQLRELAQQVVTELESSSPVAPTGG